VTGRPAPARWALGVTTFVHCRDQGQQPSDATTGGESYGDRNTIAHWSRHGIAGRGVLLDMTRNFAGSAGYHAGESRAYSVDDLERARRTANVEFEPGDILLLYTGFAEWYLGQSIEDRKRLRRPLSSPGLAQNENVVEYLWNAHVSAVVADNHAVEVWPVDLGPGHPPLSFLHRVLIGQLGMALGELWWLKDLAENCALDSRYTCFVASAPFNAPNGVGSTANAVAFK
jgi:kynurenine formamidase